MQPAIWHLKRMHNVSPSFSFQNGSHSNTCKWHSGFLAKLQQCVKLAFWLFARSIYSKQCFCPSGKRVNQVNRTCIVIRASQSPSFNTFLHPLPNDRLMNHNPSHFEAELGADTHCTHLNVGVLVLSSTSASNEACAVFDHVPVPGPVGLPPNPTGLHHRVAGYCGESR